MALVRCVFSCPYDYVRIYDGATLYDPEIGVYCGKYADIDVYSTNESMYVEFVTKSGRMEPTKRPYLSYWEINDQDVRQKGFNASFEISDRFVDLSESSCVSRASVERQSSVSRASVERCLSADRASFRDDLCVST